MIEEKEVKVMRIITIMSNLEKYKKVFSEVFDIILKLVSLVFFEEDSFVLNK